VLLQTLDAAGEDREAEEQTSGCQHVDNAQPDLTPVETIFSRRLINDKPKNRIFSSENRISEKTILTSLIMRLVNCSGMYR